MCPDKELSEEEGLGKVNGLTWGEGEGSRKRKGQPRPSWEAVSQVAGDSLAVPTEGCVQGGLIERKVSYYHLKAEGMDQKTRELGHWVLESDKDLFFPSKVRDSSKKAGYYSTNLERSLFGTSFPVGLSYENTEKWGFVALSDIFHNHPTVLL